MILRLRTGHNKLNSHLYHKLKIGQTDMCPCGTGAMTAGHILQECPLQDELRRSTWPEGGTLREKLYGGRAALERTALYIRKTGLSI